LAGHRPDGLTAKDIALNLLKHFGADSLLGFSVELYGDEVNRLTLDERITISSMATEMGAVILIIPPGEEIIRYCNGVARQPFVPVFADPEATFKQVVRLNLDAFERMVSLPGKPHDVVPVSQVEGLAADSVFIGSCTNGRMDDLRAVAGILKGRKTAPGVVLKIVPATDDIWNQCLKEGLIAVFKESGALVSNAGCAGCASGQVGQNGPGEVTVSTGNRNFTGKQGKGEVYLASPEVAAATAVAGYICTPEHIPPEPAPIKKVPFRTVSPVTPPERTEARPTLLEGKIWLIPDDNIDTDMIYHNRHLAITDPAEMGRYTFGNLKGWERFPEMAEPGDVIITGRNFGAGSSRQQAVDCFRALGIQAIVARSFGAIYERNAINAGFPVLTFDLPGLGELCQGDRVIIDLEKGTLLNLKNGEITKLGHFSEVQMKIYRSGDLLSAF